MLLLFKIPIPKSYYTSWRALVHTKRKDFVYYNIYNVALSLTICCCLFVASVCVCVCVVVIVIMVNTPWGRRWWWETCCIAMRVYKVHIIILNSRRAMFYPQSHYNIHPRPTRYIKYVVRWPAVMTAVHAMTFRYVTITVSFRIIIIIIIYEDATTMTWKKKYQKILLTFCFIPALQNPYDNINIYYIDDPFL